MADINTTTETVEIATEAAQEAVTAMPKDKTAYVVAGASAVVLLAAYGVKKLWDRRKAKKAVKEEPAQADATPEKADVAEETKEEK